ncbi:MAG: hypothetical protein ACE5FU_11950, partial [Nitrospinota bacterium]
VTLLGVKQEYRRLGLDFLLINQLYQETFKTPIRDAEMSWVLEDNVLMNRMFRHLGAKVYKRYSILNKKLKSL